MTALPLLLMSTIWALGIGLTLSGTYFTLRHFRRVPRLDLPYGLYPVSILKPLKGLDGDLEACLETFFTLDYPDYELIFSVASSADPAASAVVRLMRKHPRIQSRLIVGDIAIGPNPKVNNLIKGYESAAYDLILISDSNVRAPRDYLKRLVAHLDNGVGMVSAIVAGRGGSGTGGALEATYLNTFYARWMKLTQMMGKPCVVGKSMLFKRSVAKRFGGIRVLARYLAEDFMAGEAMRALGLEVRLAADPVEQHIGRYTISQFWARHVRWGRLRKAQAPLAFAFEPLFGPLVSGLLGAFALSQLSGVSFGAALVSHLALWCLCDQILSQSVERRIRWYFPLLWTAREALAIPLWIHVASGSTVEWRGKTLKLQKGGLLETS